MKRKRTEREHKEERRTLVRFTLLPEFASGLDGSFASVLAQIFVAHDFTANEFVLKVGAVVRNERVD